ncbi:hypothetical protein ACLB9X_09155 [Streptomyces sp. 5K101]|uniref:SCO2400 family protein n=1 Tax=Streptomyces sp. 5K101 TaxID=3390037 RepID=UPI0039758FAE
MCPGCGAYARDIAPPALRAERATTAAAGWEPFRAERSPASASPSGPAAEEGAGAPAAAGTAMAGDGSVVSGAPGRAARRRQLARWKKNRRRAVAGTAIALVGGGLTIAALPSGPSKGRTNAASAPETVSPHGARMSEPVSPSAEPAERATRKPDAPASPTAVPRQRTATITVARPTATPPAQRPVSEAAARPEAQRSQTPAPRPTVDDSAAQQPSTSGTTGAAGGSDTSGEDLPQATPSQTATTSPGEVCLLVLCLG